MTKWPPCPVCEEDELACLVGDPKHVHDGDCSLYCYRCGTNRGTALEIEWLRVSKTIYPTLHANVISPGRVLTYELLRDFILYGRPE